MGTRLVYVSVSPLQDGITKETPRSVNICQEWDLLKWHYEKGLKK